MDEIKALGDRFWCGIVRLWAYLRRALKAKHALTLFIMILKNDGAFSAYASSPT
jgi:hypothetical protein